MKKKYFRLIFWLSILLVIFASTVPFFSVKEKFGYGIFKFKADKWLHLFAYFTLAFIYILWQLKQLINRSLQYLLLTLSISLLLAFLIETIQLFIPSRSFSLKDFTANAIGIVFPYLLLIIFKEKLKKTKLGMIEL